MFFLPRHLQRLLKAKDEEENERVFEFRTDAEELDVFPIDPLIRPAWFSLTTREREVAALVCMGYKDYEIASMLGIGYQTQITYMQNIFDKFDLRNRGKIRAALVSWPADEWWKIHHK